MQFFTYVGIGFVAVSLGSIAVGFVRGLIARRRAKKILEKMKEI